MCDDMATGSKLLLSHVQALIFLHEQYRHVDQQAFKGEDTQG